MQKQKTFLNTRFTPEVLQKAVAVLTEIAKNQNYEMRFINQEVEHYDSTWNYDLPDEFYADYRNCVHGAKLSTLSVRGSNPGVMSREFSLSINFNGRDTYVTVNATTRSEIENTFAEFEASSEACQLPNEPVVVFIGHGRKSLWMELKNHLQDKHRFKVEAYETRPRTGRIFRETIKNMASRSSFAVIVLTAEDEQGDGQLRARQNVIHETGFFQGRLGFERTIMLIEDGVEKFSNEHGADCIHFSSNNIKETFGDVVAVIRSQFSGGVPSVFQTGALLRFDTNLT